MTPYRTCKHLSSSEAAYIAGLVDGEGTITLSRKHRNELRQLAITISSTEKPILDFVLRTAGIGKITDKRTYAAHHLPSFTYAVYNRQALSLLKQITPLLNSYKARRARLLLREYIDLTPRNGKYSDAMLERRTEFEKRLFAIGVEN